MQADPQSKEQLSKKKWLTPAEEIISPGGGNSPTFHEATYFSGGPGQVVRQDMRK